MKTKKDHQDLPPDYNKPGHPCEEGNDNTPRSASSVKFRAKRDEAILATTVAEGGWNWADASAAAVICPPPPEVGDKEVPWSLVLDAEGAAVVRENFWRDTAGMEEAA